MAKSGPPLPVSSENNSRMSKLVTDFGMKEMIIAVDLLKVMKYTLHYIILFVFMRRSRGGTGGPDPHPP